MQIKCCLNCDKREVGCHSKCESYIKEKNDFNEFKEKVRKKKLLESEVNGFLIEHLHKKRK